MLKIQINLILPMKHNLFKNSTKEMDGLLPSTSTKAGSSTKSNKTNNSKALKTTTTQNVML